MERNNRYSTLEGELIREEYSDPQSIKSIQQFSRTILAALGIGALALFYNEHGSFPEIYEAFNQTLNNFAGYQALFP